MAVYGVVIPARNEEKYLPKTLEALQGQTQPPGVVVVVDDGSRDRTAEVAESYGCHVVRLPDRGLETVGMPQLAETRNVGFKHLEGRVDYLLSLDADHVLSREYAERVLERMEADPKLAIASGRIVGEVRHPQFPTGSGRFYRAEFLDEVGWSHPVMYGWETYMVFKALQLGYRTAWFPDVPSWVQRPTHLWVETKLEAWGRAMKTLGYWQPYVWARAALVALSGRPRAAGALLRGYYSHKETCDIACFVRRWQIRNLPRHVAMRLKGRIHW